MCKNMHVKTRPQVSRFGLKAERFHPRWRSAQLQPQTDEEILTDLLHTIQRRLEAGERIEGRILHKLENLRYAISAPETFAFVAAVMRLGPCAPTIRAEYEIWAEEQAPTLTRLRQQVAQILEARAKAAESGGSGS